MRKLFLIQALVTLVAGVCGCTPCDNPELPRDVALTRAQEYLKQMAATYDLREARLMNEVLNANSKAWSFEFRSGDCIVLIGTDACNGTDVEGLNAACKSK